MIAHRWGAALLALLAVSCRDQAPANNVSEPIVSEAQKTEPLQVTLLEEQARASLAAKRRQRETQALDERVRRAMEGFLFDPFSARYREVRSGRSGAICGEYNAKNQMGAFTGFKDCVVGRDGRTVYTSAFNDGVRTAYYGSFAEAYVNVCASAAERQAHRRATEFDYMYDNSM